MAAPSASARSLPKAVSRVGYFMPQCISFDEVAEAHRRLETGGLEGKLVLCPTLPSRRDRVPPQPTHFLMKTLKRVSTEMARHVLAYNLTRATNILGTGPLIDAMRA
jgi:hypothetical protein